MFVFVFVMHCFVYILDLQLLVASLLLSYRKKYYVTIPRGAVGWSALCDCGIS